MTSISTDEWLSELDRIYRDSNKIDGITTREIALARKTTQACVRMWLRKAIEAGQWECRGYNKTQSMDGRMTKVPVYGPKAIT